MAKETLDDVQYSTVIWLKGTLFYGAVQYGFGVCAFILCCVEGVGSLFFFPQEYAGRFLTVQPNSTYLVSYLSVDWSILSDITDGMFGFANIAFAQSTPLL